MSGATNRSEGRPGRPAGTSEHSDGGENRPDGPENRLDTTFARLRAAGELGLFPYLTAGYPDLKTSATLLDAIAESGADGLELGIPFSDPLADGVTLQRASARALEGNVSLTDALALVRGLRQRHQLPVVIMSYMNPLLAYGLPRLCQDAADAGVDGFIVPDLSLEEAPAFQAACASAGLHYVYMVAPTSGEDRLTNVGGRAGGFVYCVALVGTTGARTSMSSDLPLFLATVRERVSAPLVVGFGISTPAHVAALVGKADGVIVASALADLIERTEPERVEDAMRAAVRELKDATRSEAAAVAR